MESPWQYSTVHNGACKVIEEQTPLLDEDEALDYILYEDMEEESEQQPGKGCLAGALLFLLVPGSVGLLMYML
jgi:hypothetical protein